MQKKYISDGIWIYFAWEISQKHPPILEGYE